VWTSSRRWATSVTRPTGLGRLTSQVRLRACNGLAKLSSTASDRVHRGPGWSRHRRRRDGAYDFRVYASGPCHPVHPARFVPQYPMGADGHGSAGLPEISEDRAPRMFWSRVQMRGRQLYCSVYTAQMSRLNWPLTGTINDSFECVVGPIKEQRPQQR